MEKKIPTIEEKIDMNEELLKQALADYGRYTDSEVLEDVSPAFIRRLAEDSTVAKEPLRNLFRKSPAWNEELDALVINGNRTHDPDPDRVWDLGTEILHDYLIDSDYDRRHLVKDALRFFVDAVDKESGHWSKEDYLSALSTLAPDAYKEGKKLSRVFRDLCIALGIADQTAGSRFQRLYAQFADELSSRQIEFKLFVAIGPDAFVTMSNPKRDRRGTTLTSCHSFNSTDYEYNNGCSGYARDGVTFIAYTAADWKVPETLHNRKTSRQVYCYLPGNGVLLQSRLYNTNGGTHGAQADTKLYRDLIQREISEAEGQPNLWRTFPYVNNREITLREGRGFGGYADWTFRDFDAHVSIRQDKEEDYETFTIGTYGLCIACAEETSDGVYCYDCSNAGKVYCSCCDNMRDEDEMTWVTDRYGERIQVCESCLEDYYVYCVHCEEYHHIDNCTRLPDGDYVCDECRDEYYAYCDDCDEWYPRAQVRTAINWRGNEIQVCDHCLEERYVKCEGCGTWIDMDLAEDGLCPDCLEAREEDQPEAV